jgi:catechol 2,3-dioxygenase-like lactoylglutathione lyase family enzyme
MFRKKKPVRDGLGSRPVIACVATTDKARAREFYADRLGLRLISEDQYALLFDAHGTKLRISVVRELQPAPYAVLGWVVPDVRAAIAELTARSIPAVHFEGMGQDEHGIWTSPAGVKVAWFKDPDGNALSLTQIQY